MEERGMKKRNFLKFWLFGSNFRREGEKNLSSSNFCFPSILGDLEEKIRKF